MANQQSGKISSKHWILITALVLAALALWFIRPLFHSPVMLLYKYPLFWFAPLVAFAVVFSLVALVGQVRRKQGAPEKMPTAYYSRSPFYPGSISERLWLRAQESWFARPALYGSLAAFVAFLIALPVAPVLTGKAIHDRYPFAEISELPEAGEIRLMPKQVAEQLASNGFNVPSKKLVEAHIVRDPESARLAWSFQQAPDGLVPYFAAKTRGMALLDAETTARDLRQQETEFEVAPNQGITDNLSWQAYKMNYLTDLADASFILSGEGEVLLIAPYISYEGFPVKVPVLGGVYVVHPDGEIEDLSPEEAAERDEIVASGRLFPEELARRVMDAYKYKNGIWNRFFVHREQTNLADTEGNPQPYLMDFAAQGTKWVATAQPHGKSGSTNAVFMIDTVSGEAEIWRAPAEAALTGNSKAIEIVEALSIPGVVFSGEADEGGKFEAVEPRPLFIDGQLMFLISVVPNSYNTVTKSVVVDAAQNKVVAIFDHDTEPDADEELAAFIRSGEAPDEEPPARDADPGAEAPPAALDDLSGAEVAEILRQLEEIDREEQRLFEELRRRLEQR